MAVVLEEHPYIFSRPAVIIGVVEILDGIVPYEIRGHALFELQLSSAQAVEDHGLLALARKPVHGAREHEAPRHKQRQCDEACHCQRAKQAEPADFTEHFAPPPRRSLQCRI